MDEHSTPGSGPAVAAERRAATPIAGSIAGILFAITFGLSVGTIIVTVGELSQDTGSWLATGTSELKLALSLVPFSGIFFLWFMAVVRERLGHLEDQFFSTIFFGSGLLFLAMVFSAAGSAGAILESYSRDPVGFASSGTYVYARQTVAQVFSIYALRMAALFQISQGTLWLRTKVMPRWIAFLTYAVALVLLFISTQSLWVIMLFPAWVLLVSVYLLAHNLRRSA